MKIMENQRPIGIVYSAVILILVSFNLLFGVVQKAMVPPPTCSDDSPLGSCYRIAGNYSNATSVIIWGLYLGLLSAAGVGLLFGRKWARLVSIGLSVPLVFLELLKVLEMLFYGYSVNGASFYSGLNLIFLSSFLYYLTRSRIKELFK